MDKSTLYQEKDYQLISRFFDFDLSEKEMETFENRLDTDTDFRQRFQVYKEMDLHIDSTLDQSKELQAIKKNLKLNIDDREPKIIKHERGITRRQLFSIAAAILLFVVSLIALRLFLQEKDASILAQEYWDATEKLTFGNLRSTANPTPSEIRIINASEAFNQQNYTRVISSLANFPSTDIQFPKAALLQGEAYMALNNPEASIAKFQVIIEHTSGEYKSSALWYQALAYLAAGNKAAGKANLEVIIDNNYPTATKANELLTLIR